MGRGWWSRAKMGREETGSAQRNNTDSDLLKILQTDLNMIRSKDGFPLSDFLNKI
jgi:hypothetical protein